MTLDNNETLDINNVLKDKRKLRIFFSRVVPLTDFIEEPSTVSSAILCPFHDDSSPSAKIFHDIDGTIRLHCFTENRQYTSFDYLTNIMGLDPVSYLTKNYSDTDMNILLKKVDFEVKSRPIVGDIDQIGLDTLNTQDNELDNFEEFLSKIYFEYLDKSSTFCLPTKTIIRKVENE